MERIHIREVCFYFAALFLFSACSHASIADLKETEASELSKFDVCVRDDTLQLVATEGTTGEIADFVMNACDSEYHRYKDAVLNTLVKQSAHPDSKAELETRAEKLSMTMWDKIRLKVVKLVEKKRGPSVPETPRPL